MLQQNLNELLLNDNFSCIQQSDWTGKSYETIWERKNGWKRDVIRLIVHSSLRNFFIDYSVKIFPEQHEFLFDAKPMLYLMNSKKTHINFPRFWFGILYAMRAKKIIKKINKNIHSTKGWFEITATPEKCIAILEREKELQEITRNGFGLKLIDKIISSLKIMVN